MDCWKCGKQAIDPMTRVGFRAACPHCEMDLHVCKNCRYYAPGKPNDCAVPGTEYIRDREAANFCEEFRPKSYDPKSSDALKRARRLFGEE